MVLFIGAGFKPLPQEDKVISTLQSNIPEQGLYFFPGKDLRRSGTPKQEAAFLEKFRTGPVGILVYRPHGGDPLHLRFNQSDTLSHIYPRISFHKLVIFGLLTRP
jgi:hypothetical protein